MYKLLLTSSFIIFLISFFFYTGCEKSTAPEVDSLKFSGITETDENGTLIGNFDRDDWSFPNIFFNNAIQINPHTSIGFVATQINQQITIHIKFKNFSSDIFQLSFSQPGPPFYLDKSELLLVAGSVDSITASFILPDTSNVIIEDILSIQAQSKEKIDFTLKGIWENPNEVVGVEIVSPVIKYSFLPAYPNPAQDSITFRFVNIVQVAYVNLNIIDINESVIKKLVDKIYSVGDYTVKWDLKNDNDVRVDAGLYRARIYIDDFISHGDIMIE